MASIRRFITAKIAHALRVSPVVFLNGPRQAGESTLVQRLSTQSDETVNFPGVYVTLDSAVQMAAAAAAPEAFLTSRHNGLIIDEIQMVPELFRSLKVVVDELRRKDKENTNGRYLLTGSANILALPNLADPLVGRMSVLTLYPFCVAEATGGKGNGLEKLLNFDFSEIIDRGIDLMQAIGSGTFPEIANKNPEDRGIWFDGYLATILQRDVKQLAALEKISILPSVLRVLVRAGGVLNDSDIAREVGLNSVTGKFYRHILKMMFLSLDVEPWHRNIGKRLVKASKGYLIDTLLVCHMLDLQLEEISKKRPELFGHIVENFVATELMKLLSSSDRRARLLHFRTSDGKKVDFVIEGADGTVFAIEVKRSEIVTIDDFKGIQLMAQLTEKDFRGGVVLYNGKEAVPFGKNLWAVPIYILWQ
jgi:predicted AAA+ superfamily ATPase